MRIQTTRPFAAPSKRRRFGPVFAGTAVISLAAILFGWTEFESWARQRELERALRSEGGALVEALGHAVEHALMSNREIEELASARLLDIARLLELLEGSGRLDGNRLVRLAGDLGLHHVLFLDSRGRRIREACPDDPARLPHPSPYESALAPLLEGKADGLVLGPRQAPYGESMRYAAAVRRAKGGAVLAVMDADAMLAFQRTVGPANLVEAVGATGGIVSAILEDDRGNVLASTSAARPAPDRALELERPVTIRPGRVGRLRVALAAEALEAAAGTARRRALATAVVAFALAVAVGGAVAARRRAEHARRESDRARSLTDAVLDGISDAVIVADADRVLRLANPAAARLFGREVHELVGHRCEDTPCAAVAAAAFSPGGARELTLETPDGGRRNVLVASSPVEDEGGAAFGTALVLRDLTDTRRLEREAQRTESLAAFGRLAASVAHEVRNPLNAIAVGVQRLQKEFLAGAQEDEPRRLAGVLREEIARLDGIVGRFLELARRPRLEPRPGDLDAAVQESLALAEAGLPASIRLRWSPGGVRLAVFDGSALRQILHNLVRNAAEATEGGGEIRVRTDIDDGRARLVVEDDGVGIRGSELERVFEFGFTTKARGNGLGLPIVHRLVAEMGGRVAIESSEGKGTIVRVWLELAPDGERSPKEKR